MANVNNKRKRPLIEAIIYCLCIGTFALSFVVFAVWFRWLVDNHYAAAADDWRTYVPVGLCAMVGVVLNVWRRIEQ
jgi:hypothetical protein